MFTRPEGLSDETVAGLIASDWAVDVESAEYTERATSGWLRSMVEAA